MKQTKKRLSILILCGMLVLGGTGCQGDSSSDFQELDDSLERVLDSGRLILGFDEGFPPMGFVDKNGDIIGFDIDVAQEVCDRLGIELVTHGMEWYEKEKILNEGSIDCIWNGLSLTPARAETMTLSEPYMKNELIIVVPETSDAQVLGDLKGRRMGVQLGSSAQEALEDTEIYPEIEMKKYDTVVDLLDCLHKGEVDAALIDSVSAFYFVFSSDEPFFILSESLAEEDYCIGFRKGEVSLCNMVQEILCDMKADGTLGRISNEWFGSDITTIR